MRRTGCRLVVPALACALASCGGSAPSDLFSSPADGGVFDVSVRDQGVPRDTGVQPAEDAAEDTGMVVDATQPTPEAAAPEAAVIEAGPPSYSVDCGGSTTCSGPAQTCCVSGPPGVGQTESCVANASSCNGPTSTPVACTTSSQCPSGEICCGHQPNGAYTDVSCRSTCDGNTDRVFCDPNASNDCPPGMMCVSSTLLGGFNVCN